jgi:DNA-binding transcriptional LysR family regulator
MPVKHRHGSDSLPPLRIPRAARWSPPGKSPVDRSRSTGRGRPRRRRCSVSCGRAASAANSRPAAGAVEDELSTHRRVCGIDETWSFTRERSSYEHRPDTRFRCNSGYAEVDAALSGLGLCQLPDFYVEDHLRGGTLVEVLAEHRPKEEDVWAVSPPPACAIKSEACERAHAARIPEPPADADHTPLSLRFRNSHGVFAEACALAESAGMTA